MRRSEEPALGCGIDPNCTRCSACYQALDNGALSGERLQMDEGSLVAEITRRVMEQLGGARPAQAPSSDAAVSLDQCPVGVSVRHMHVTREHLNVLFGADYQLEPYRPLYQPGDYASQSTVTLVGRNLRAIQNVRILGPERNYTQVELSRTDAIFLKLNPPIRPSGHLEGAEAVTIVGPRGSVTTPAVILANRHIHICPEDAARLGLSDGQEVRVETRGEAALVLDKVFMKFGKDLKLELHVDTDVANAAGLVSGDRVRILKQD